MSRRAFSPSFAAVVLGLEPGFALGNDAPATTRSSPLRSSS